MRSALIAVATFATLLGGCIVHHTPHRRHHRNVNQAPPPEAGQPAQPSNPGQQPPPPPRESGPARHRAPAAPAAPQMSIRLDRNQASPGQEVTLYLTPFDPNVMVYFGGRPLPKKVQGNGITVTVPSRAGSGHFEVEWNGQRFRSPLLTVQ